MRFVSKAALILLLVYGACLSIGCGDEGTGPENPPPSTGMTHLWSKRFGDVSQQGGRAVAVDGSRNVVVAGWLDGTADFGGGPLTSAGYSDIFVAKLGSDGGHLWSRSFGDGSSQRADDVAVDASGHVIVTGWFNGTVDFGGGPLTSTNTDDMFIAKFGSDGTYLWSKHFGNVVLQSVAVDASENVIITGTFDYTVDFGGGELASVGPSDIFVAKLGADGGHLWSQRFGGWGEDAGQDVAVDASGNVIVTGVFDGTIDFGGGALTSAGNDDIFVAKLGSDGGHLWSRSFGDESHENALAVAVDASENVIVTGWFQGTIDFGGGVLTGAGNDDIFVAKLGSDGGHLWSKRFGGQGGEGGDAVAADAAGNVIVTGWFDDTVDFGGGVLTTAGSSDIFIAKFGSDGGHIWSKGFGSGNDQYVSAVAVDVSNHAIVTGTFHGTVDFGGGVLTSAGSVDIFVAKFAP